MILENMTIEELLDYYELDSVEDFEPTFYYQNLVNGYQINKQAVNNLLAHYSKETLLKIRNYRQIGIVEFVAENKYYVHDNYIIVIDDEELEDIPF